jgi:hypothetical protein
VTGYHEPRRHSLKKGILLQGDDNSLVLPVFFDLHEGAASFGILGEFNDLIDINALLLIFKSAMTFLLQSIFDV